MKNLFIIINIVLLLFSFSCCSIADDKVEKNILKWIIVPGINVGHITKETNEKKLIKIFGEKNIFQKEIHFDEHSYLATSVFNGTKNEIQIIWKNETRESPKEIIIASQDTQWHTNQNITIGTSLESLEKINKNEIEIHGFGWDYGGYIKSWGSGLLSKDHKIGKSLMIELSSDIKIDPIQINNTVREKGFLSSNPAIKDLNLKISKIIIILK